MAVLAVDGVNPFYAEVFVFIATSATLVESIRASHRNEARLLRSAAKSLDNTADYLDALGDRLPSLSGAQLRTESKHIRNILLPALDRHGRKRRYKTFDYALYALYAYVKQAYKGTTGIFESMASVIGAGFIAVEADRVITARAERPANGERSKKQKEGNPKALRNATPREVALAGGMDSDSLKKRVDRFRKGYPRESAHLDAKAEDYVSSGNDGWDLSLKAIAEDIARKYTGSS